MNIQTAAMLLEQLVQDLYVVLCYFLAELRSALPCRRKKDSTQEMQDRFLVKIQFINKQNYVLVQMQNQVCDSFRVLAHACKQ